VLQAGVADESAETTGDYECDHESICRDHRFLPLANVAEQGMPVSRIECGQLWERSVLDPVARLLQKCLPTPTAAEYSHLSTQLSLSSLSFLVAAPCTHDHAQKAECECVSKSVNPLPSFQQVFSI